MLIVSMPLAEDTPMNIRPLIGLLGVLLAAMSADLTGCGKSRDFGKTVMKRARNGNSGLI